MERDGATIEFTYQRNSLATDVTFTVEYSDNLEPGSWVTTGVVDTMMSDNGSVQQWKATIPAGVDVRFVRLRIDHP